MVLQSDSTNFDWFISSITQLYSKSNMSESEQLAKTNKTPSNTNGHDNE